MSDFQGLYLIRDYKEADKSFIMATFLRGLYYGDFFFNLIPKDIFMDNYKKIAEAMLGTAKVHIKVACLKEDPDVILGYSILSADHKTIHWCFVKGVFRRKGIAKSLTPSNAIYLSHLSALGKTLMHKFPNAVYNPFSF